MKDIIDEKNEKERIRNSIIKYWNVNYVARPQEMKTEVETEPTQPKRTEMDSEMSVEELYNVTTGAYSGKYGKVEIKDEVTKGQIDKILKEKTEALSNLIERTESEKTEQTKHADGNIIEEIDNTEGGKTEEMKYADSNMAEE